MNALAKNEPPSQIAVKFAPVLEIADVKRALEIPRFAHLTDGCQRNFLTVLLLNSKDRDEADLVEDVRLLVEAGADVNAGEGKAHVLPLQAAVGFGRSRVARFLLDHGANANALDREGSNAVKYAVDAIICGGHDFGLLALVLDRGADVNAYRKDWGTPLDEIYWRGCCAKDRRGVRKVVTSLVQHGGKSPRTDEEKRRQRKRDPETARLLRNILADLDRS